MAGYFALVWLLGQGGIKKGECMISILEYAVVHPALCGKLLSDNATGRVKVQPSLLPKKALLAFFTPVR